MFPGFVASDADGTRTRNHRIDSPVHQDDLGKEKPNKAKALKIRVSKGDSNECQLESNLAEWLEACPLCLKSDLRAAISLLVRSQAD